MAQVATIVTTSLLVTSLAGVRGASWPVLSLVLATTLSLNTVALMWVRRNPGKGPRTQWSILFTTKRVGMLVLVLLFAPMVALVAQQLLGLGTMGLALVCFVSFIGGLYVVIVNK